MALNYDDLMATSVADIPFSYGDTETMLYALSVGFGRDPLNRKELGYVYERGLQLRTVPTMATVLVPNLFPADLGWDYTQVLHSEQRLILYRPLPAAADILINRRVAGAVPRRALMPQMPNRGLAHWPIWVGDLQARHKL